MLLTHAWNIVAEISNLKKQNFLQNAAKFCKIPQNGTKYCKLPQNAAKFCKMAQNTVKCRKMLLTHAWNIVVEISNMNWTIYVLCRWPKNRNCEVWKPLIVNHHWDFCYHCWSLDFEVRLLQNASSECLLSWPEIKFHKCKQTLPFWAQFWYNYIITQKVSFSFQSKVKSAIFSAQLLVRNF